MAQQRRRKPSLVKNASETNGSHPEKKLASLAQKRVEEIIKGLAPEQAAKILAQIGQSVTTLPQSNGAPASANLAEAAANPLQTNALSAGVDALTSATELPFPEFTAKLLTTVFDGVFGATYKQVQTYAELVADLAKSIKDFEAGNVSDGQVTNFLADKYPDGSGNTSVRDDYVFAAGADLGQVFFDLVETQLASIWTGAAGSNGEFPRPDDPNGYTAADSSQTQDTQFTAPQVAAIRKAVRRLLAEGQLGILRMMAEEGMDRIQFTDGRVFSKFTFQVKTSDEAAANISRYTQSQVTGGGHVAIKTRVADIGFRVDHSSLAVKVINERTYSKVTMDADLIAGMDIHFQSAKFAPVKKAG